MSSWISGILLRVIELLRAVQENSLVYSKQKNNTVTRAIPGTEMYVIYWATPGTQVLCFSCRCLGPECSFDAGNKTPSAKTCTSPPKFSNHT
jgi:hypothetical protein